MREAAGHIAYQMYSTKESGLEADVADIEEILSRDNAAVIMKMLKETRIARVGGDSNRRFSFVHRRFAEFFVVDYMRNNSIEPDFESIPTDSRWRDCLAMYCGIIEPEKQQEIAQYCWRVIKEQSGTFFNGDIQKAYPAIHCLRFINDSFRDKANGALEFQHNLGFLIRKTLSSSLRKRDFLIAKISVESVPILDPRSQQNVIHGALTSRNEWLIDTAFSACKHIGNLDYTVEQLIRDEIKRKDLPDLFAEFQDLYFSLSLSDALKYQKRNLALDLINSFLLVSLSMFFLIACLFFWHTYLLAILLITAFIIVIRWNSQISRKWVFDPRDRVFNIKISMSVFTAFTGVAVSFGDLFVSGALTIESQTNPAFNPLNAQRIMDSLFPPFFISEVFQDSIFLPILRFTVLFVCLSIALGWESILKSGRYVFKEARNPTNGLRAFSDFMSTIFKSIKEAFDLLIQDVQRTYRTGEPGFFLTLLPAIILALLGGFAYENILNEKFKSLFQVLGSVFIAIVLVFYVFITASQIFQNWVTAYRNWQAKRSVKKLGFPETVSVSYVYKICLKLDNASAQKCYLESLRRKHIPLNEEEKEIPPVPKALLEDPGVAEEIARLREQWYGLSN